ncbi:MAG TPA: glycosyltransferase [Phycisphaerae bacterium]|nr:glycosyltransferase family 4 protein [Phycisphaerae bacterium]HOI53707.1 glycosyltransferase [Phycisphaerae bacterium]
MRVLMLGWEFPPFISGGLGTACYGLTRAMSEEGVDVTFVLPRAVSGDHTTHVRLIAPAAVSVKSNGRVKSMLVQQGGQIVSYHIDSLDHVTFVPVDVELSPYETEAEYAARIERLNRIRHTLSQEEMRVLETESRRTDRSICAVDSPLTGQYGRDLLAEVHRYARLVTMFAPRMEFDVIHAHDWMTFPAALAVSRMTGKPLVVHVHSTEFDRSGEHVDQRVYDIERAGMHGAAHVVAVSNLTRNLCVSRYGVDPQKVSVVYNAIDLQDSTVPTGPLTFRKGERLVLFLGRMTMQKGPDYFVAAAKKVLDKMENVTFIMAGDGDMFRRVIERAADLGIGHKILFTGFLRGDNVQKVFRMADLFVMPSVSEPFGLVPLEAMSQDVPVIISKQSGVSEVLTHVLKVDFWDINEMANKIIAVLRHAPLRETLKKHAHFEVRKFSWRDASRSCVELYERLTSRG